MKTCPKCAFVSTDDYAACPVCWTELPEPRKHYEQCRGDKFILLNPKLAKKLYGRE